MTTKLDRLEKGQKASCNIRKPPFGIVLLLFIVLSACGDSTPEARLEAVGDDLDETIDELINLDKQIEEIESNLGQLRSKRRDLRDKMRTLEQRLDARATDVAIFRAVQSALLEDSELQESAISVSVEDGAVTLTGVVRREEAARRAISLSKQTTGVHSVSSQIQVNDPSVPAP